MQGYTQKALIKFQHAMTTQRIDSPHKHTPIKYGAQPQLVTIDTSPKLSPEDIIRVQTSWEFYFIIHALSTALWQLR